MLDVAAAEVDVVAVDVGDGAGTEPAHVPQRAPQAGRGRQLQVEAVGAEAGGVDVVDGDEAGRAASRWDAPGRSRPPVTVLGFRPA